MQQGMMYRAAFSVLLLIATVTAQSDGISGCGGSVKVSQGILNVIGKKPNFSNLSVSLLTSDGVVQEQTVCSPQGFFFIPLYDIGEYELVVSKEEGWSVSPSSFHISMNEEGSVLGCEEQREFEITGFRIRGHAHNKQSKSSVKGVQVTLFSQDGRGLKTVETDAEGNYTFDNVLSGEYTLKADHPSWVLALPVERSISIGFGSVEVEEDFIVSGFKITGVVENRSGKHSLNDIQMILKREDEAVELSGSLSDTGRFEFRDIETGDYVLRPSLGSNPFRWDIEPDHIRVSVKDTSVDLGAAFAVTSFTIHGHVVDENGHPVPNICVRVNANGKEGECTNEAGYYELSEMEERAYMIDIKHSDYQFTFNQVTVEPGFVVPDLIISHYTACGHIETTILRNYPTLPTRYTVNALQNGVIVNSQETPSEFCLLLPPGVYDFNVTPVAGVSFTTIEGVRLGDQKSVNELVLSPMAQSVGGQVLQVSSGTTMNVQLRANGVLLGSTVPDTDGRFMFNGVLPGEYEVRVETTEGCWGEFVDGVEALSQGLSQSVDVRTSSVTDLVFKQTGYVVTIQSPVPMKAAFVTPIASLILNVSEGVTRVCMKQPQYEVTLHGCVEVESSVLTVSPSNPHLEVIPIAYRVSGLIELDAGVGVDVHVFVYHGNEMVDEISATKKDEEYEYSLSLPPNTYSLRYSAPHSSYLFHPNSRTLTIVPSRCQEMIPTVTVSEGRVVSGQIIPPLAGVTVRMTVKDNGKMKMVESVSNENGEYSFTPISQDAEISLEAVKEGHIFHASPNGLNFSHQKLSSLRISVYDSAKLPVSSVLLSLSSDGFNKNQVTRSDGTYVFGQLFPGEYFLQVQLKEYAFDKPTQIITITEGTATEVEVHCTRVAYSVFGRVTTITGQPQSKVRVVATAGTHKEVAFTDAQGSYRIRGLHPATTYSITVMNMEHLLPTQRSVNIQQTDVLEADFIVLNVPSTSTLHGVIDSQGKILDGLQVTAVGGKGKKVSKVSQGGSFEFNALTSGEYTLRVESTDRHSKVKCSEVTVSVERNALNEAVVKCELEENTEMDVGEGGSFLLLAVVVIAVFIYLEREQLRLAFKV